MIDMFSVLGSKHFLMLSVQNILAYKNSSDDLSLQVAKANY